jgi:S-DNA-T family DNA segregation ATPase FtsK/SpoIIIE
MRPQRRSESALDALKDALRAFLARRAQEIIGVSLVAATVFAAIALGTWSADDPSLNNATDAPVKNALAFPGAVASDILMQLFGLGAVALVVPPAIWGWRLLRRGELGRVQLRLALWVIGGGAATAVASALPVTDRWPLPTGLGGVCGDALMAAGKALTGLSAGPARVLLGLAFAGVAVLALTAACGFGLSQEAREPRAPRGRAATPDWDDADEGGADDPGWGIVSLGALAHGLMSLRAAVRRFIEARRAAADDGLVPAMAGAPARRVEAGVLRREPSLEVRAAARPAPVAPPVDEDEEAPARVPQGRVAPAGAPPKPGRRIVREAQPSLLDEAGAYALPALALLAEPKRSATPTVSTEALEQNAALLEGTLEDFGVKGEIINVRPGPVVTLYELEPAPGTKSSRVISLADDIARSMSAVSARVAVVQGRNAIGIELPNHKRETVFLRELLASQDFETTKHRLALCLGKTIGGEPVIADLARMPHLLVAGTTGSGK